MSSSSERARCERWDLVASYALGVLELGDAKSMAAHLAACSECQQEYYALGPLTDAIAAWREQTLPPATALWEQLTNRIEKIPQYKNKAAFALPTSLAHAWQEPQWSEVAPGISCKLLSTDTDRDRVTMLVRLAPGVTYPPHRHARGEELYLMEGELWIEDRKLHAGDYYCAEPGTSDNRVWSDTGCMCLLITSPSDELR